MVRRRGGEWGNGRGEGRFFSLSSSLQNTRTYLPTLGIPSSQPLRTIPSFPPGNPFSPPFPPGNRNGVWNEYMALRFCSYFQIGGWGVQWWMMEIFRLCLSVFCGEKGRGGFRKTPLTRKIRRMNDMPPFSEPDGGNGHRQRGGGS